MNPSMDVDAVVASKFASECGLQDIAVHSWTALAGGGRKFELSGVLVLNSAALSPEDAKVMDAFLDGEFRLHVVVYDHTVISHEWIGVQTS